jgi:hypothetical protein
MNDSLSKTAFGKEVDRAYVGSRLVVQERGQAWVNSELKGGCLKLVRFSLFVTCFHAHWHIGILLGKKVLAPKDLKNMATQNDSLQYPELHKCAVNRASVPP